jgi:hypothetical protein
LEINIHVLPNVSNVKIFECQVAQSQKWMKLIIGQKVAQASEGYGSIGSTYGLVLQM